MDGRSNLTVVNKTLADKYVALKLDPHTYPLESDLSSG